MFRVCRLVPLSIVALFWLAGCGTTQHLPSGNPGSLGGASGDVNAPDLAEVTIGSTPGVVIPSDYVGLSHEWGVAEYLAGTTAAGKNLAYRQLLGNLLQYTTKPMVIRIGGNSTDTTTKIQVSELDSINELQADLDDRLRFTLGINMGADDTSVAAAEIELISAHIPVSSLLGLELGNEPDGYAAKGWRPASYGFVQYSDELNVWNQLVASKSPWSPVSPALAGFSWIDGYEKTLSSSNAPPLLLTQHYYAGEYVATQPETSDFLLADEQATTGPGKVASYIDAVHHAGKKLRIGELNSLSHGGQPGVSNSFSSALWGIDIMFEFARSGADGVNWHTGNGGAYDLFQFNTTSNENGTRQYALAQVRPLFYGLQLFEEATVANGALLPVSIRTGANLKVWAVQGDDGNTRVVLLNKDETQTGSVTVSIAGYTHAMISRLLAPAFTSQSGVTLGGQTFDGSVDGTLQGSASVEPITVANGSFVVTMPAASAALVTLSR